MSLQQNDTPTVRSQQPTPPPSSVSASDDEAEIDDHDEVPFVPVTEPPIIACENEHHQDVDEDNPTKELTWSLPDFFEYRSGFWHCRHTTCQRRNQATEPSSGSTAGKRMFGRYQAPRYGNSGIIKRAKEHARKHERGEEAYVKSEEHRTRWWRNGKEVRPGAGKAAKPRKAHVIKAVKTVPRLAPFIFPSSSHHEAQTILDRDIVTPLADVQVMQPRSPLRCVFSPFVIKPQANITLGPKDPSGKFPKIPRPVRQWRSTSSMPPKNVPLWDFLC